MQLLNTTGSAMVRQNAEVWPAVYMAPVAGLAIGALLLFAAQRPRRRPRLLAGSA
jgi:lipopolysaccharide export system permease protein